MLPLTDAGIHSHYISIIQLNVNYSVYASVANFIIKLLIL